MIGLSIVDIFSDISYQKILRIIDIFDIISYYRIEKYNIDDILISTTYRSFDICFFIIFQLIFTKNHKILAASARLLLVDCIILKLLNISMKF